MRRWGACVGIATTSLLLVAGSCGGGSGSGGRGSVDRSGSVGGPDGVACTLLPGIFPPGLDFVPGLPDRLVAANLSPAGLFPFEATSPPVVSAPGAPQIPPDSDGDGLPDFLAPVLDGVLAVNPDLALLTASTNEQVLFVDPESGELRFFEIEVPAGFDPDAYRFLPAPGTSALRTAVSTRACVPLPPGAVDSAGDPFAGSADCAPGRVSTSFTSGVAVAAGRLFVSTSNLGARQGAADTQFLPGTVLVFELDLGLDPPRVRPDPAAPFLLTTAFNPTHVTRVVTPGGRELVLVTLSGALGLILDDPGTPQLEAGGIPLSDAAIDVIDPATLEPIATIPLGLAAPSFDRLAVDPSGRVAFTGGNAARELFAVDLAALDLAPTTGPPAVLDGTDPRASNADARIFDATRPLAIPGIAGGAPPETCAGFVTSTAFDAVGGELFALDFCDGTLARVSVDLSGAPPVPVPGDRFVVDRVVPVAAPVGAGSLGLSRAPGALRVRPGPGQPDLFFLLSLEEGQLCAADSTSL